MKKELYKLRKEKIERSFADSKQNHGYRYALYKEIENVVCLDLLR